MRLGPRAGSAHSAGGDGGWRRRGAAFPVLALAGRLADRCGAAAGLDRNAHHRSGGDGRMNWRADPLVRGRRPRRLAGVCMMLISLIRLRDEGVPRGPGGPPSNLREAAHAGLLVDSMKSWS